MRLWSLILASLMLLGVVLTWPETARTQDAGSNDTTTADETEDQSGMDDPGFIERQIQNLLGGEGRTVRISGLEGVLSSQVRIGRIEVDDADGNWLAIDNVELDWRRLALLRRRFEVEALTVGAIDVLRRPLPPPREAPAVAADETAEPFSLPQLPVAVNVGALTISEIDLEEPVLGYAIEMSLNGSASLEGGDGQANLTLERIDGPQGRYALAAGFDNDTRNLLVDLDVTEDEGGLIASLSNMPGAPSLELTVKGDAPISDFTANIALSTDDVERLAGFVRLEEQDGAAGADTVVEAQLGGDVAQLFLPEYRSFFGRDVSLDLSARRSAYGLTTIENLDVRTQALTLSGSLELTESGWPEAIELQGRLGTQSGVPVVLPLPGPPVSMNWATISVTHDQTNSETIQARIQADGVARTNGLQVATVDVTADGTLRHGSEGARGGFVGEVAATVDGMSFTDEALWDAVGDTIRFGTDVDWTQNGPLSLTDLRLSSNEDLSLTGAATINGLEQGAVSADATLSADARDLSRFSKISGQDLTGALSADVTADYALVSGAFDVTLDGTAQNIALGTADANALLAGETDLGITARRNASGITLDRLSVNGQRIMADGTAVVAADGWPESVVLNATIGQANGAPVTLPVPGQAMTLGSAVIALNYNAAEGDGFTAKATIGELDQNGDVALDFADIDASGTLDRADSANAVEQLTAQVRAAYRGFSFPKDPALSEAAGPSGDLSGQVNWVQDGTLSIDNLSAQSGDLTLSGAASVTGLGTDDPLAATASGDFATGALQRFAAISGQELSGSASGTFRGNVDLAQTFFDVTLDAQTQDLVVGTDNAAPLLAGRTNIGLTAARNETGVDLSRLMVEGGAIDIGGTASLAPDFWPQSVDIAGRVGRSDGAVIDLPGADVSLRSAQLDLKYDESSGNAFTVLVNAAQVASSNLIALGDARLQSRGTLERQDGSSAVSSVIADLSASLSGVSSPANSGLAQALGTQSDLTASVDWDLDGPLTIKGLDLESGDLSLTAEAVVDRSEAGALKVDGSGKLNSGSLSRFAALSGQNLRGTVDATANGNFDQENRVFSISLDANASNLAIGIPAADGLIGGATTLTLRAQGEGDDVTLSAFDLSNDEVSATASGKMTDGDGAFTLSGRVRDLARIAPQFSGPLTLDGTANGQDGTWRVDAALQGPATARADVNGIVLQDNGELDLTLQGVLPLALADTFITPRSILGEADLDLSVRGQPGLDAVSGTISVTDARISDPATRLALEDTDVTIALANGEANLDFGADVSTGGRITASGPVTLSAPFDADIAAELTSVRLEDPRLYTIDLGGNVDVVGALTGGASIDGRIDISRAEIKIPATFGESGTIVDVVHIDEPQASLITRKRAGVVAPDETEDGTGGGGGPAYPLDIVISAPNEIFVRGRGLDAELGGEVEIGGTTQQIVPTGGFSLLRGRLNILARRLEFSQAEVTLQGDLVPYIQMVASSTGDGITANIEIEGPINDPEINFTSTPELPEDEVLAQLFFGKPINDLTPLEAAQLVAAINTLRGGGGPGILGRLRQRLGVDNIDIESDQEGNTEVSAGKYLTERIYTDVAVDSENTTSIELNYDITPSFKARTTYRSDGNTGFGFSFERDY